MPAYGISEAAHYLRIPLATLRSWVRGRFYPTEAGQKHFKPIISLPDPKLAALSFVNLVEAHVLDAIRREHQVPFPNVRSAVSYVQRQFGSKHPLAEQRFETDGVNLFVSRFEKLVSVSEPGQPAIRELIQAYLRRIEYDLSRFAVRLYPFTRKDDLDQSKSVVIDPYISFGRPTIRDTGVSTSIIAERYQAGDSMEALADDYGFKGSQIEEALRFELAFAA